MYFPGRVMGGRSGGGVGGEEGFFTLCDKTSFGVFIILLFYWVRGGGGGGGSVPTY